ncbi:HEPN domain-containing protein [Candidatus Pyrohabitans sp.]
MNDLERCFKEGLLKKTSPSKGMAKKSINQAKSFLSDSSKLTDLSMPRMEVIALYNAFFHTARALLFKDGVKERSHYCVARYVESEYVLKNKLGEKFISAFDSLRDMRHVSQYALDTMEIDEDLTEYVNICVEFIAEVEKLVNK